MCVVLRLHLPYLNYDVFAVFSVPLQYLKRRTVFAVFRLPQQYLKRSTGVCIVQLVTTIP